VRNFVSLNIVDVLAILMSQAGRTSKRLHYSVYIPASPVSVTGTPS
jgi:hypothetical protein